MREIQDLRPVPQSDEIPGGPSGLLTLAAFPPTGYEPPKVDPEVASALDKASTVFDEMAPVDNPTSYIVRDLTDLKPMYVDPLTKSQRDTLSKIYGIIGKSNSYSENIYMTTGNVPYKNQIWNNSIMIDGIGNIVSGPMTFSYNRMLYSRFIMASMSPYIGRELEKSKVNLVCCHDAFLRGLDKVSDYKGDISKGYMEINMPFMRFMALILSIRLMFGSDSKLDEPNDDPIDMGMVVEYLSGDEYEDIKPIVNHLEKYSDKLSTYAVPLTKIVDGKLEIAEYTPVASIIAMANAILAYYSVKDGGKHGINVDDPLLDIVCAFDDVSFCAGLMSMYKPASVRTPEFIQAVDKLAKDHPEVWQPALTEDGNAIKRSNTGFILSKYLPSNFERPFKKYYKNHEGLHKEFEPWDGFYDGLNELDNDPKYEHFQFDFDNLCYELDRFFGRMLDRLTDDDFRIPIHIYGISDTYGPTGYDADNTTMSVTKQPDGTYVKNPIIPYEMSLNLTH